MRSGLRVSAGMGSLGGTCAAVTWLGASMTCACAGRFGGDVGFVSACGNGAACVLNNIGADKRISEKISIPVLIVGCTKISFMRNTPNAEILQADRQVLADQYTKHEDRKTSHLLASELPSESP